MSIKTQFVKAVESTSATDPLYSIPECEMFLRSESVMVGKHAWGPAGDSGAVGTALPAEIVVPTGCRVDGSNTLKGRWGGCSGRRGICTAKNPCGWYRYGALDSCACHQSGPGDTCISRQ